MRGDFFPARCVRQGSCAEGTLPLRLVCAVLMTHGLNSSVIHGCGKLIFESILFCSVGLTLYLERIQTVITFTKDYGVEYSTFIYSTRFRPFHLLHSKHPLCPPPASTPGPSTTPARSFCVQSLILSRHWPCTERFRGVSVSIHAPRSSSAISSCSSKEQ